MSTAVVPFAARKVPSLRFSSSQLAPSDALGYWQESLSHSWDLSLSNSAANSPFYANSEVWRMERMIFGMGAFGPTQIRVRRERNIRADQLDLYRLIFLREGQFDCDADGRQTSLQPGHFVITDMARNETNVSSSNCLVLFIPRDQLDDALPHPMDLHGISPDNACSQILFEHLAAMLMHMPEAAPEELAGLTRATVSLVAASIASTPENMEDARAAVENVLLRRGRRFIELHLQQEALGVSDLCAELRISRSTLYRVFAPLGGVAQYVKERRLARIHEALSRGDPQQSISRLAERFGFKSAAHFSSAFREQYGYSAREVARGNALGTSMVPTLPRGEHLHGWLGSIVETA